jgi:hypothetical protein
MKKLILSIILSLALLAVPGFGFADIDNWLGVDVAGTAAGYIHDLDMETAGAITTVPNAGSGGTWECNPADTLDDYRTSMTEKEGTYEYNFNASNEYIIADNALGSVTNFRYMVWWRPDLTDTNLTMGGFGSDANATVAAGELLFRQIYSDPNINIQFRADESGVGTSANLTTVNFSVNIYYCLAFEINTNSGGTITITGKRSTNVTTCEWDSVGDWDDVVMSGWDSNPDAIASVGKPFLGVDSSNESDCRYDGYRLYETP